MDKEEIRQRFIDKMEATRKGLESFVESVNELFDYSAADVPMSLNQLFLLYELRGSLKEILGESE